MLKTLPLKTILRLTELINAILKRQYFSKAWKTAIIVPIPKPGKKPQKADSYRPIKGDFLKQSNKSTVEAKNVDPLLSIYPSDEDLMSTASETDASSSLKKS
ncbi:hypothetical protein AVEN_119391-1 [Araneus ventricosus]|uniref:RNA-directed DNA polymerase from transposon X-element n=1 Tax=Araneus ventricosus TaxID=182803 RepID=A0A4Y2M8F3_ARAVE|nr:hypothetical protein AVEN_119391-1 [Araneus ventricosus]